MSEEQGGITMLPLLPLTYPAPEVVNDGKLLSCQCPQRRLASGALLFGELRRVSAAVVVMPVGKDDVGALVDVSDDMSIFGALIRGQ